MRKLVAVAAMLVIAAGCSEEKPNRGAEALPDMFHTPAHKAQTAIASADGSRQYSSMLAAPEGTVPRNGAGYTLAAADWEGAKRLSNPLSPSREVLRTGQHWFNVTCAVCHGRDGNSAHGNVAASFSGIPSVNGANVLNMADGTIYHIVSRGRNNRMPDFRAQLPPAERWAVVTYVKVLARASVAAQDAAAVVADAEAPGAAPEVLAKGKTLLAQRKADLEAILALGSDGDRSAAAATFAPLPEPVPEYVPPKWPTPVMEKTP